MAQKVYIEGGGPNYQNMWASFGFDLTDSPVKADVIQFTGGSDVHPSYYDEVMHRAAACDKRRDEHCFDLFNMAKDTGKLMTGICRGGQFLNVANGGKMFQHCDGHATRGTHKATILESGLEVDVTSTHHQIMRPNRDKAIILMEANPKLGTFKEHMYPDSPGIGEATWVVRNGQEEDDVEAVFYPDTMSLSFQPHPEYCAPNSTCVAAYRSFLRNYLDLKVV